MRQLNRKKGSQEQATESEAYMLQHFVLHWRKCLGRIRKCGLIGEGVSFFEALRIQKPMGLLMQQAQDLSSYFTLDLQTYSCPTAAWLPKFLVPRYFHSLKAWPLSVNPLIWAFYSTPSPSFYVYCQSAETLSTRDYLWPPWAKDQVGDFIILIVYYYNLPKLAFFLVL